MKKILITHSTNNIISGAEYAINDMLEVIPDEFIVEMQTPGYGPLSRFYIEKGYKVSTKYFIGPRRKYPGIFWISSLFYSFWLKRKGYDIVLCNTFAASFRVSLAAKLAGINLLIYTREYFSKKKKINFKQIKRAHSILAVSDDVKNYFGDLHEKIYVCHDTINISQIESRIYNQKKTLFNKNDFNVGYLGRITKYKQPDILIKAVALVSKVVPNIQLHIVGSSIKEEFNYEKSLHQLVEELHLNNYVKFWGHRTDSIELLYCMDVFCLTSDREPFPRTLIEAMIVKTPVICSNTGGCPEIVDDYGSGLFFKVLDQESVNDLANKIIELHSNQELKNRIIENAYNQILDKFSKKNQVEIFFDILKNIPL